MLLENNPFTPSFGRTPLYMAGRSLLVNNLAKAFRGNGNDPYLQTAFVGARGTGKTALLSRACEIASGEGWVSASTTCVSGMLDDLLQQALAASTELVESPGKAKLKGVTIGQVIGLEWDPAENIPANWRMRMSQLIDKLAETGTGLLLTVDEVRANVAEMERLSAVFQHFVREEKRVALLMAGLPHQISQLVNSDAVSFLRRATKVNLGPIDDMEISDALEKTAADGGKTFDQKALDECVNAISGFAYMMQLVGFRAWDASGEVDRIAVEDARRGIALAKHDLEQQILIPTWTNLSNGDRAFCRALALGNRSAKAIAAFMGKKPNYVSKYKQRLLEQGVIEQDAYARLDFSLPGFKEFVLDEKTVMAH